MHITERRRICIIQHLLIFCCMQDVAAKVTSVHFKQTDTLPFVGKSTKQNGTFTLFKCSNSCLRSHECFAFEFDEDYNFCTLILYHNTKDIGNDVTQLYERQKDCKIEGYHYIWPYDICIKPINDMRTWEDADAYCKEKGGHLVSLESAEKQSLVVQIIKMHIELMGIKAWWTGGTDMEIEGQFKWTNGREFNFTNWATNQPDNGGTILDPVLGADCLILKIQNAGVSWYDRGCPVLQSFVCENRLFV